MLPRLLLVVGLSVAVMLPLIWVAFAPVADLREVSETDADPIHNGPAGADRRRASTPEAAEPSNPTVRSDETTIGTAPDREREASAALSDDLPATGHSEPIEIKPSLPQAFDKGAASEPVLTEKAKPLPEEARPLPEEAKPLQKEAKRPPEKAEPPAEEAATPAVNVEKPPEVKEGDSASAATPNGRARARAHGTERQKTHRKKQRDHSGWVSIMREAGWLAPGQRR